MISLHLCPPASFSPSSYCYYVLHHSVLCLLSSHMLMRPSGTWPVFLFLSPFPGELLCFGLFLSPGCVNGRSVSCIQIGYDVMFVVCLNNDIFGSHSV